MGINLYMDYYSMNLGIICQYLYNVECTIYMHYANRHDVNKKRFVHKQRQYNASKILLNSDELRDFSHCVLLLAIPQSASPMLMLTLIKPIKAHTHSQTHLSAPIYKIWLSHSKLSMA